MVRIPVMVAIDTTTGEDALALARAVEPSVGAFKIGLGLLHGAGPGLILELTRLGKPVFADAKLHDIPSQVERAAVALGEAGARWVTVHASGGADMLAAAVRGLGSGSSGRGGVLGVTVLTSLDAASLTATGIDAQPSELVRAMAAMVASSGAEGLVCSPHEIALVREVAPGLSIITPGIRLQGSAADDQRRVATPREAIAAGATWLVVGRPITAASDPVAAAAGIAAVVAAH